jgi:Ohr subfamily peroxiredoxin
VSPPGTAGTGTNPEQLFAAGWSTCFLSAIKLAAAKKKVALSDVAIDAEVDLGTANGGYGLAARLNVSLPGLEREVAHIPNHCGTGISTGGEHGTNAVPEGPLS